MAADVLFYRLYRLRRLILVAALPPALAAGAVAAVKGPAALVLLVPAVGVPLAHALRYPNAWTETLAVSLAMSVLLPLAGTIGGAVGLPGLALRLAGLGALGVVLFLLASRAVPALLRRGRARRITAHARRRTALPLDAAREAVTLHPGREDGKVSCGQADADGTFPVTIRHRMPALAVGEEAGFDVLLYAQVLESTDTVHEVMSVEAGPVAPTPGPGGPDAQGGERADAQDDEPAPEVCFVRHVFTPGARGTLVEVAETGAEMTPFLAFGFWLQDGMADRLTDEIDRAEGRPPRANRFAGQDQLVVDLARGVAGGPRAQTPAE